MRLREASTYMIVNKRTESVRDSNDKAELMIATAVDGIQAIA